jgi:hypothetical protein
MSMMGELTIFLGIQVNQMKQGTFIHNAKYMTDLMKKFNMVELKPVSTPMSTGMALDADKNGEAVQEHDWFPPVSHGDTARHSVHRVHVCVLSVFPMLFTSDSSLVNLQVPQTHT